MNKQELKLLSSVINGIMSNPNTSPTREEHFNNITDDAIKITKTLISKINE